MTDRLRVCPVEAIEPGDCEVMQLNGISVAVCNVDGEFYAIGNRCLHQGGPICEGRIKRQRIVESAEPGERVEERLSEKYSISCPRHGWEYDIETGDHLGDSSVSLPTFDVRVEDGELFLEY